MEIHAPSERANSKIRLRVLLSGREHLKQWAALVLFRIALNADSVCHYLQPLVKTN